MGLICWVMTFSFLVSRNYGFVTISQQVGIYKSPDARLCPVTRDGHLGGMRMALMGSES